MFRTNPLAIFICIVLVACPLRASGEVRLIANSEKSAEISGDRYRVSLEFAPDPRISLWTWLKDGTVQEIGSFPLEGFAQANDGSPDDASVFQFVSANKEKKDGGLTFTLLYRSPNRDQHQVVLTFTASFFSYSMSVVKGRQREIAELFYLARGGNGGEVKYGEGNFEQVRTWTPDLYDVLIPDVGFSRRSRIYTRAAGWIAAGLSLCGCSTQWCRLVGSRDYRNSKYL
jgi:hypothetical protein